MIRSGPLAGVPGLIGWSGSSSAAACSWVRPQVSRRNLITLRWFSAGCVGADASAPGDPGSPAGSSRRWIIFISDVLPPPQGALIPIVSGARVRPSPMNVAIASAYSSDSRSSRDVQASEVTAVPGRALARSSRARPCRGEDLLGPVGTEGLEEAVALQPGHELPVEQREAPDHGPRGQLGKPRRIEEWPHAREPFGELEPLDARRRCDAKAEGRRSSVGVGGVRPQQIRDDLVGADLVCAKAAAKRRSETDRPGASSAPEEVSASATPEAAGASSPRT